MKWYKGSTLLEFLENLDTSNDIKESSLRLPIQFCYVGLEKSADEKTS